jgi:hypothetical protein
MYDVYVNPSRLRPNTSIVPGVYLCMKRTIHIQITGAIITYLLDRGHFRKTNGYQFQIARVHCRDAYLSHVTAARCGRPITNDLLLQKELAY